MTIEEIQKKTAEFYKLDLRELHSTRRARRVARPRQVAMFLARELTSRSLPDIGRRFGGRDHTTVLHACRRIEELCKSDPVFQQEVDFLRKVLGAQQPPGLKRVLQRAGTCALGGQLPRNCPAFRVIIALRTASFACRAGNSALFCAA